MWIKFYIFEVRNVDGQSEWMCHRRTPCIFKTEPRQIKKSSTDPQYRGALKFKWELRRRRRRLCEIDYSFSIIPLFPLPSFSRASRFYLVTFNFIIIPTVPSGPQNFDGGTVNRFRPRVRSFIFTPESSLFIPIFYLAAEN